MADVRTGAERPGPTRPARGVTLVDPRAPRFGQGLTALGLTAGLVMREPLLVGAVALVLATSVATRWRVDLWATLWRRVGLPVAGRPDEKEPAAPHRFAKLLGATFTGLAVVAFAADLFVTRPPGIASLSGLAVLGYGLAGLVAALAGLAAATGVCVGCRMYRQVSYFRRLGVV